MGANLFSSKNDYDTYDEHSSASRFKIHRVTCLKRLNISPHHTPLCKTISSVIPLAAWLHFNCKDMQQQQQQQRSFWGQREDTARNNLTERMICLGAKSIHFSECNVGGEIRRVPSLRSSPWRAYEVRQWENEFNRKKSPLPVMGLSYWIKHLKSTKIWSYKGKQERCRIQ